MEVSCGEDCDYTGGLSGSEPEFRDGRLIFTLPACGGEIWIPGHCLEENRDNPPEIDLTQELWIRDKDPERREQPVNNLQKENLPSEDKNSDLQSDKADSKAKPDTTEKPLDLNKPYEEMNIAELQAAILNKLAANGPVTDRMRRDVEENVYRDSLLNWVKSFR